MNICNRITPPRPEVGPDVLVRERDSLRLYLESLASQLPDRSRSISQRGTRRRIRDKAKYFVRSRARVGILSQTLSGSLKQLPQQRDLLDVQLGDRYPWRHLRLALCVLGFQEDDASLNGRFLAANRAREILGDLEKSETSLLGLEHRD